MWFVWFIVNARNLIPVCLSMQWVSAWNVAPPSRFLSRKIPVAAIVIESMLHTVHTIVIQSVLHTLQCTGTCFGPTTFQMPMSSPIFLQTMNHVEIMENKRSSLVVLLCKQWCHWQVSQCFVLNHCNVTAHFTWCKMHDTTICYMLMGLWFQKDWKMGSNCNRYKNGTLI